MIVMTIMTLTNKQYDTVVKSGKDLADKIEWVKFSGASWLKDGSGFFYRRYDAPTEAAKLSKATYFHKL